MSISCDRRETFTLCHSSNVSPLSRSSVIFEALWRYRFLSMKYTSDIDTPFTSAGSPGLLFSSTRIYDKKWRVASRRRKYISADKTQQIELSHWHRLDFLSSFLIINFSPFFVAHACDARRIKRVICFDPDTKKLLYTKRRTRYKQIIISGTCFAVIEIANDRNGASP